MRKREIIRIEKRRKERKKKGFWRQKLLVIFLAAMVVIAGGLVSWFLLAEKEISFEDAMKKPELRDAYIQKVVAEIGKPEYVVKINYEDTPEELEFLKRVHDYIPDPIDLMTTHPAQEVPVTQLGKRVVPVRISILPYAFSGETLKTGNDFISSLLHEYHHARMLNQEKIDSIDYQKFLIIEGEFRGSYNLPLINVMFELTAIREELSSQLEISNSYRAQRLSFYLTRYRWIWDYEEGMDLEFIKSLKIEFFEEWMLGVLSLFKEWRNGKEVWYFKHPETGREYYLPEEIVERFSKDGKG